MTVGELSDSDVMEKIFIGIDALIVQNVGAFMSKAGHNLDEETVRKICLKALKYSVKSDK
jgi:hypothetical protein